jgi:hypothetical protein
MLRQPPIDSIATIPFASDRFREARTPATGRVLPVEEGSGARKEIAKTYVRPYKAIISDSIIRSRQRTSSQTKTE